jgi:hypothetical protein
MSQFDLTDDQLQNGYDNPDVNDLGTSNSE